MDTALGSEPRVDATVALGEPLHVDSEELARLLVEGHERGTLSYESIAAALEESELGREQVGEVCAYLEEHGIELVAADDSGEIPKTTPEKTFA